MAYQPFTIGAFDFSGMTGSISVTSPVTRLRIEERIGVNGFEITALGSVGQRSRLVTFRDLPSWESGFALHKSHLALVGAGPQSLTVNGFPLASIGVQIVVLGVQKLAHKKILGGVGNMLEESPQGYLDEAWTFITKSI